MGLFCYDLPRSFKRKGLKMAAIGSIFRVLCLGLEYVVYRLSRLAGGRASVTQWQQRRLGQPVGKWRWGAGAGAGEEQEEEEEEEQEQERGKKEEV